VTSLNVTVNKKILVQLPENPTTGYTWNVTLTNGLELLNDTYVPDKISEGMVGVGGVHEWIIQAIATGDQSFNGIYKQAWEPVSGNDTTYTLDLLVK
jgi:inhibitor of cysteine peptidase